MFVYVMLCARCAQSPDLLSPFEADADGNVGAWQCNGGAVVSASHIMLSPPVKFSRGGAWTGAVLPEDGWAAKVELSFDEIGGGGFGIWVIDNYGDAGALCGGPTRFRGIGLIGRMKHENGFLMADLNLLENNGNVDFGNVQHMKADTSFIVSENKHVFIELSFRNGMMNVSVDNSNLGKLRLKMERKISLSISNFYFGITSQSEKSPTKFDLYSVQFRANRGVTGNRKDMIMKVVDKNGHFQPVLEKGFRNEKLNKLIEPFSGNPTCDDVLGAIEEVNEVNSKVATFKDVNNFVINDIVPYSQKWEKRTVRAVQNTKELRNVVETANKITKKIIESFNETLISEFSRTKRKINNLEKLILDFDGKDINQNGTNHGTSSDIPKFETQYHIIFFMSIELLILLCYFIIKRNKHDNI